MAWVEGQKSYVPCTKCGHADVIVEKAQLVCQRCGWDQARSEYSDREGSYLSTPCKFCGRVRVDKHDNICEKCRKDQETGEYVFEPDPIDEVYMSWRDDLTQAPRDGTEIYLSPKGRPAELLHWKDEPIPGWYDRNGNRSTKTFAYWKQTEG